jgi:ribosomal protein S18 acetylase RimI-like enzyme
MAKTNTTPQITFRPAKPEDGKTAGRLLFDTFAKEAAFVVGRGSEERAKKILAKLFSVSGHRLSYEFSEMILLDGQVVGVITSFPGKMIGKLNRSFAWLVMKQYRLRGKLALVKRGFSDLFVKEAAKDEFHLAHLSVKPRYRGKGVGGKALSHFVENAKLAGFTKVSLTVDIENKAASRLYERHGYQTRAINLIPKKLVPYLGSGSLRMVKNLDQ